MPIRILIAKPGLDGHDRGAKVVARALRDAGCEVIYTGLHQTPADIATIAVQEDVNGVGLSALSGAHQTLFPAVVSELADRGASDVVVFGGGIIPDADIDELKARTPDLAIFDLQVGSMGGMAITMALRLDESAGALPHVPVLMLVDRRADLHLARRCGAEGWLIKPLDALRLKRAARAITNGGTYTEGLPADAAPVEPMIDLGDDDAAASAESAEEETVDAG